MPHMSKGVRNLNEINSQGFNSAIKRRESDNPSSYNPSKTKPVFDYKGNEDTFELAEDVQEISPRFCDS